MVASEKVAELRQSISNKLAGIDRSHSWPDGMARSQLQAMVKELEGQCQQAYAWVADNSESAPSMADESQDIGGRKLTEELEDRLGIDDDDWELVTSRKKGRGRHQQGTGRGGGGGDGGARRRQPHHRQRQGGRNNRP